MAPLSIPSPPPEWATPIHIPWFNGQEIPIHSYALCILAGIIVATVWTSRRLTKRGAEPGIVLDIAIWAVPLGIVGARAYHVLTHPNDYFFPGADPWEVIRIWNGGGAIFGALIGGGIGVYIACRITGIRFWSFADALAPGLLAAQALGRFGNWFNHELFGQPTTLPWGLEIEKDNAAFPVGLPAGTLFQPTFLYEIIWNVIGIAVLVFFLERRYTMRWGKAFGFYLIWYGLGRWPLEAIRLDPSEIFLGVRTNIWAAWGAILLGVVIILVQRRRHPGLELSPYRPGKEWTPPLDPDEYVVTDGEGDRAALDSSDTDAVGSGDEAPAGAPREAGATSTTGSQR
ncbi:prolipoprotein diacylglyceryl transferase [Glaciibacter flavus]|uniref:Phosphatidylglycerol--prolipoprotein diacylglyceryl transferase n=1 Tax=Orlajensenia flava TaxID=2565934 RepID=A0A4S4FZ01_9MICO|nr:prolipoprotein diacylglyceryl transferase [Glaciibacter flavus]THG35874.1 prolipoprotein diacylglyceryl transferase [Glaciibacter flavus]